MRLSSKILLATLSLTLVLLTSGAIVWGAQTAQTKAQTSPRNQAQLLAVCQQKENRIASIEKHIIGQLDKHLGVFDKLRDRTIAHLDKVTSAGHTVSNSAALVAAMDSARDAAVNAIAKAKSAATFSCTAPEPKNQLLTFIDATKLAKKASHDYRLAIKNLNVAVSTANGETLPSAGNGGSK